MLSRVGKTISLTPSVQSGIFTAANYRVMMSQHLLPQPCAGPEASRHRPHLAVRPHAGASAPPLIGLPRQPSPMLSHLQSPSGLHTGQIGWPIS